ncbi:MAG: glycosyltransferase family 4 protein [Bacteroidales bacterium]|nr:glycosyltransferase family 4 protein [Bacteroidales bacterium]
MKIGIEGQRLFRVRKHGMDMVALELIRNLQKIDHENEYVIFVSPDEDKCLRETGNFKIRELAGGAYPWWEQFALPKAARKEGCDILHCTSNTAPVNSKTPLVITLHDIIYLESLGIFKKAGTWYQKLGNLYRRLVVPPVVKRSKKIITVSHYEKHRIADFFGFKNSKLEAVYNGVGEKFKKIHNENLLDEIKNKYHLPERFIFFLGNTDPKKNTPGVLKAFSALIKELDKKIPLVLLDFDEDDLDRVLDDINDPDLKEHIILTGYVINKDLPAIYNLSELFLYPSLRESFGIPILEAMSCGTPVITSNTSSMPEVAGDAGMIVDPYDPPQIKEAILRLLNDNKLKENLISKGYEQAAKFSWANMARDVLNIYKSVYQGIQQNK